MSQTHGDFNGNRFEMPKEFDAEQCRQLLSIAEKVDQEILEQDLSEDELDTELPPTDKVVLDELVKIVNSQTGEGLTAEYWDSDEIGKEGFVIFRVKCEC